jgi:hypothetical protein
MATSTHNLFLHLFHPFLRHSQHIILIRQRFVESTSLLIGLGSGSQLRLEPLCSIGYSGNIRVTLGHSIVIVSISGAWNSREADVAQKIVHGCDGLFNIMKDVQQSNVSINTATKLFE